ncbi:DUF6875 domain-containing protein [Nonomuraea ferruginea]
MCPYAQASLDRGAFRLAVQPGGGHTVESLSALLAPYRDWFLDLAPPQDARRAVDDHPRPAARDA